MEINIFKQIEHNPPYLAGIEHTGQFPYPSGKYPEHPEWCLSALS
jgi:hypothetical protein